MADRALRGMRMGSNSLESEDGVTFVDRQEVTYECPVGHTFDIPFAIDAEVPASWECPMCSRTAVRAGLEDFEDDKPSKPQRTHWDMLLERRTIKELDELLEERLEMLRTGRIRRMPR